MNKTFKIFGKRMHSFSTTEMKYKKTNAINILRRSQYPVIFQEINSFSDVTLNKVVKSPFETGEMNDRNGAVFRMQKSPPLFLSTSIFCKLAENLLSSKHI